MSGIRNIGIFAHVDAGKTTLSEQLLVHTGAVTKAGAVDSGTAHTDLLPVERRRGISVRATCVSMTRQGVTLNLIDTPGHMDFSAEVERSFWALDGAILLIDAAEGVQPQTEVLARALAHQGLPYLIFLNKMDRPEASPERCMRSIHERLTADAVLPDDPDVLCETLCEYDDALMERYCAGEPVDITDLDRLLAVLTREGKVHPVLTGSALRDDGIEKLLDAVIRYLPEPGTDTTGLSGVVFSSSSDRVMGRGLWVRLFGGSLENRQPLEFSGGTDPLTGEDRTVQKKITQIRDPSGRDIGHLQAGEVGVIYGLGDVPIGHVFGSRDLLPRRVEPGRFRTPLITVQVIPDKPEDLQALRKACAELSAEDPLLNAEYVSTTGELHIQVMGKVQLEILQEMLRSRFDLKASFGDPSVIYRETLKAPTVGFVAYTMPKPCWAIMEFTMEPGPRGSGVVFSSVVPVRDILARYQHQAEQALPIALKQGRLGWPVTDVRITLTGGNHHQFHTHPLDFIVATPMAIQDGLQRGGTVLLEPILECTFLVPAGCAGRVMSDVNRMRGEVLENLGGDQTAEIRALVPVSTSMDYPTELAALSSGKGSMSASLHGYRECPTELGKTAPRRGVDPLDTARYILAARSALDGGIFDF